MTDPSDERSWSPRPSGVLSVAVAVVGLLASTVATSLALDAGEVPVTVLPFGRALVGFGLAPLVVARAGTVVALWLVTARRSDRLGDATVAGAGLFWLLWGVWQAWVLLART